MLSSSNNSCGAENDGAVAEEETAREMIGKLTRFKGNDVCADCGDSSKNVVLFKVANRIVAALYIL